MFYRTLLYLLICCLSSPALFAQGVQLVPLEENLALKKRSQLKNNQVCPNLQLSLPFFEDFANNPNGIYPDCSRWQDNHAYINEQFGYLPPSLGVATLDGLDQTGAPYDANASVSIPEAADTLTSQTIDLDNRNLSDQIVLSYFYQPQGWGDRPEEGDSLLLEFLDQNGNWQAVRAHAGVPSSVSTTDLIDFEEELVVLDTQFLHANFQFRFRNLATITGSNDHWNLDYIYLDANRDTSQASNYADVSFRMRPKSPLAPYTAVPWRHFDNTLWSDSIVMQCFNHNGLSGTLDRRYQVYDSAQTSFLLLNSQVPATTYAPSPNADDDYRDLSLNAFSPFLPSQTTELISRYIIENPSDFQSAARYQANDTAYLKTQLSNYFAYDDASAEMRIIVQGIGTQLAVAFQAQVDDTLRGIYFHLPYFTNRDAELDFINVKVWEDSAGVPGQELFSKDIYKLRYVEGFNGFHYMPLSDFADSLTPIALAAGSRFHIGWQQASSTPVPVGFDRNNSDAEAFTHVKVGGNAWQDLALGGAVMIRPVLSPSANPVIVSSTTTLAPKTTLDWKVFPNPLADVLIIEGLEERPQAELQLYNSLGQLVAQSPAQSRWTLPQLPSGIYYLSVWENGQCLGSKKLLQP
ncbi:T9SS type A sorting domain-containing protein [Saprospira grandis]|uniref:Secretion system C-terminal sorting domain-containing protein n=1 Tax=Saprospira grandis (strain Lewin) TaxID=984262 RepID=H6L4P4_SAPGL|nr:T9SS type A sorting domain-containing protein [Saprospira grandis]AFC23968.1 hypothetical protein SGRA_1233 [Saprospira grandis str. Lewin]